MGIGDNPVPVVIKTTEDLTNWICNNAQLQKDETALDAACWFCAVKDAESLFDGMRIKDWAHLILDGESLSGPYKTAEDVQGWLDSYWEMVDECGDDLTEAVECLITKLRHHYGIRQ